MDKLMNLVTNVSDVHLYFDDIEGEYVIEMHNLGRWKYYSGRNRSMTLLILDATEQMEEWIHGS